MGGYDVYCAICGGPLGNSLTDDLPPDLYDEDEIYDRNIVTPETAQWLDRTRVIGENPDSDSMDKVYVSGPARGDDAAFFMVEAGDDPNFPEDMTSLQTYNDTDEGFAFPFHEDCYDLLHAKIGAKAFRKDVLYHTFMSYVTGEFASALSLDWGTIEDCQDQYWGSQKGTEEYVLCPTTIPRLQQYYAALPRLESLRPPIQRTVAKQASEDPFSALPAELLHILLDRLSLRDMLVMRQASAAVLELDLTNAFWRQRISHGMSWLYDIPTEAWEDDGVDWLTVYKDLFVASQRGHKDCMLPLVNRRRIWTTMDQIVDTYFAELSRIQSRTSPILENTQAGHMPSLVSPEPNDTIRSHLELLHKFEDIAVAQPRITVYWDNAGHISGLSVATNAKCTEIFGDSKRLKHSNGFVMPADDWLMEVTLVSTTELAYKPSYGGPRPYEKRRLIGMAFSFGRRDTLRFGEVSGDRRVLRPSLGHLIIGFLGDASSAGHVSKLAVLEQPRGHFPADCSRITHATGVPRNMSPEKSLWSNVMPDSRTVVSEFQQGYWGADMKPDTLAMEKLTFAETDAEWATIVRISGDMHMGGFMIDYSDRDSRTIGPRLKMRRSLSIDGAGGERVICVTSFVEHIVKGLRFLTNRGRVLAIGIMGTHPKRYSAAQLDGRELTGIYCSWSPGSLPTSRLETFGVLSKDHGSFDLASSLEEPADERGFVWQPLPPSHALAGTGRVWGEHSLQLRPNLRREEWPGQGSIVSWLDCSRQVAEVEIFTCHPVRFQRPCLNVVGVAFRYADGDCERATIGYTEVLPDPEYEPQVVEAFPDWCQCVLAGGPGNDHHGAGPHFRSRRWEPAGQLIRGLRVWLDSHGGLSGLQFLDRTDDAGDSFCGFKVDDGSTGEIIFGQAHDEDKDVVGIKFFMDENGRSVTYNDVVVVAVQAIAKES